MRNVVLALVAVAVLCTSAVAFAQDKPAEAAKPAAAPDAAKPAEAVKPAEAAKPAAEAEKPAPAKKPEETAPAQAAPAAAPVAKPEEKKPEAAPVAKPEEKKPEPAPVAKPEEKKPELAPVAKPEAPVPTAPAVPIVPEKPASAGGEPATPAEGGGVKASVEGATPEDAKEKKTFYSGTAFVYTNTTGINPDVPSYSMAFRILPQFNFTDDISLTGRVDLTKEITNGNAGTAKRETQIGDIRLELNHGSLFTEKYSGIKFSGTLRGQLPTSKASQFATLNLTTMADLGLSRSFFGDKLSLGYDTRFYKFFHKYTSPELQPSSGGTWNGMNVRVLEGEYRDTGDLNVDYQFAQIFRVVYMFTEQLYGKAYFWVINGKTYEPTGGGPRGSRDSIDFNVELGYDITKWLSVDVGFDTSQPQLQPDSTYPSNPFWRNTGSNYTTVYFDVGITL